MESLLKERSLLAKCEVLRYLLLLDRERCCQKLLALLENLPHEDSSFAHSPQKSLVAVVESLDDSRAWHAYLAAVRESNVNVRIELLGKISQFSPWEHDQHRFALAVLASLLNDDSVRDLSEEQFTDQSHTAGYFERLAVRDFAALTLAELLDLKASPDPSWTAAQWSELREEVRERLKRRGLPNLE